MGNGRSGMASPFKAKRDAMMGHDKSGTNTAK
jgi:hypothetical protein